MESLLRLRMTYYFAHNIHCNIYQPLFFEATLSPSWVEPSLTYKLLLFRLFQNFNREI